MIPAVRKAILGKQRDTSIPGWLIANGLTNFSLFDFFTAHAPGDPVRATSVLPNANSANRYTRIGAGGDTTQAYVKDRSYVTDGSGTSQTAGYTFTTVTADVVGMYAEVYWGAGTDGGVAGLLAMAGPAHSTASILSTSAHIVIGNNQARAQYWQTSVLTTLTPDPVTSAVAPKDDVSKRLVGWRVSGTSILVLTPDGVETEVASATEIINRIGRTVCLEHFWSTGQCRPRFTKFFVLK